MTGKSRRKPGRPTPFERLIALAGRESYRKLSLQPLLDLLASAPSDVEKGRLYANLALTTAYIAEHTGTWGQDNAAAWEYMRKARLCWADNYSELCYGGFISAMIRKAQADPSYFRNLACLET